MRFFWIIGIVVVAPAGCGGGEDPNRADYLEDWAQPASADEDSLVARLHTLDLTALNTSFGALEEYAYTRYERTEQFDEDEYLIAFEEREARYTDGGMEVLARDSAGAFDFGFFRNFVSATVEDEGFADPVQYAVPDEPAYLSDRGREAFLYRQLPDTLLVDRAASVIEVRARPVEGDGQNIRRVRYYIDRATGDVVAFYIERVDLALLFREESQFYLHVRPVSGGGWVPYNTRFQTRIRMPFRPVQQFRTVATYSSYAPA